MGSLITLTNRQLRRESGIAIAAATIFSVVVVTRDWCERLCHWLMPYEAFEADEFVLVALAFSMMFTFLLFRRERQLRQEVVARRAAEEVAQRAARHDHLTGLPNRLAFSEQFGSATPGNTAVFLIDLDGFKAINDTQGHRAGDDILKTVASRLKQAAARRHWPGKVARMGGDEFSCIFHPAPADAELAALGQEIVRALADPIVVAGATLCVTASVGIACASGAAATEDQLLHRADLAMYLAKRSGAGQVALFGCEAEETGPDASPIIGSLLTR